MQFWDKQHFTTIRQAVSKVSVCSFAIIRLWLTLTALIISGKYQASMRARTVLYHLRSIQGRERLIGLRYPS